MTRRDLEKLEIVIVRQGMEKVRFRLEIMQSLENEIGDWTNSGRDRQSEAQILKISYVWKSKTEFGN